jgi:hypothetical protein
VPALARRWPELAAWQRAFLGLLLVAILGTALFIAVFAENLGPIAP